MSGMRLKVSRMTQDFVCVTESTTVNLPRLGTIKRDQGFRTEE